MVQEATPAARPPAPPPLDLRDCPWMPATCSPMRDLALNLGNPAAFQLALVARLVAWHQTPAGSLPADEAALVRLCACGLTLPAFRRAREAGGLAGWTIADDGRMYLPELTLAVQEAFKQRSAAKLKRDADAERLRQKRANQGGGSGSGQGSDGSGQGDGADADLSQRHSRDGRGDIAPQQNKTGQDRNQTGEDSRTSPPSPGVSPRARADARPGGSGGGRDRVGGDLDHDAIARAVLAGDVVAIVAACGGTLDDPKRGDQRPDWKRDAQNMTFIALAALLMRERYAGRACRWPSGLRAARNAMQAMPPGKKAALIADAERVLGIEPEPQE